MKKRPSELKSNPHSVFLLDSKDIKLNHLLLGQLAMQQQTDKIIQVNRTEWNYNNVWLLILGICSDIWIPLIITREELTRWKRLWCWEGLGAGREGDDRGWDVWMASLTRWTWVWVNSRSWWWTGRPGMLRFMGSQRVGATELNWRPTDQEPIAFWKGGLWLTFSWRREHGPTMVCQVVNTGVAHEGRKEIGSKGIYLGRW